jgi:hypothetical protein
VGIALEHARARRPQAVIALLEEYAETMPRAALHAAVEEFEPHDRARDTS